MTLNQLENALGTDATTLSRYLNGKRVPQTKEFLERLYSAVERKNDAPVTDQVRESTKELYYAALRDHEPARHEVYVLTDALTQAEDRAARSEEAVWELQAQVRAETIRREQLERELHQLEAEQLVVGADLAVVRRDLDQATRERDDLATKVASHARELAQAMVDHRSIEQARWKAETLLRAAQNRLEEEL
ncbi:hypothetical protein, partial [Kitasatospora griseola]|uniref:hypothetical protein n=1 Tax=Kitasatospora griseola TaxID=2064 RepID=UPI001670AB88